MPSATLLPLGLLPCVLRRAAQLTVLFAFVAVDAQLVDECIGGGDADNVVGREQRGQPPLPELVEPLDFAFGLGGGREEKGDAVKVQGGAELCEGIGSVGEEDAVVVDVERKGQPVLLEGTGQEIKVGEQVLRLIELRASDEAAAVVEHIQERIEPGLAGKEGVRGGIQLPQFPDLLALPAAHAGAGAAGLGGGGQSFGPGKPPDAGAVQRMAAAAVDFAGDERIGGGRIGLEQPAREGLDCSGPCRAAVAAGGLGLPCFVLAVRPCGEP